MPFPPPAAPVPFVDTVQMIAVDEAMMGDYQILLLQMMENAGRCLAQLARTRFFADDPRERMVVVLAGSGGNGGGALVAARRLHNYGARVTVVTARPDQAFAPLPAHQLDVVRRMGIPVLGAADLQRLTPPHLVLDGIIGYSLRGAPRGDAAALIVWANRQAAPVLALDAPSGLDTGSGTAYEPAVNAAATLTLALPKEGLRAPGAAAHVGELYLADISVPPALYRQGPGRGPHFRLR